MMLFKLSLRNIKKSIKDYTIYFVTLVLGVAIFYIFNSLDSQQAMLELSKDSRQIVELMIYVLAAVSIFVSLVLGYLVVYANDFIIKRRKKEFGIYMTLGMSKRSLSTILLIETILIGFVSLIVGLVIGIFASQLMSIIVVRMFDANMSGYQFVFSAGAFEKTCFFFGFIYCIAIIFNMMSITCYQLIDLLNANKKNETIKTKNLFISVILFFLSIMLLGYSYYSVLWKTGFNLNSLGIAILLGIVGTFIFFYSLSGFILRWLQTRKSVYLKGLNCFTLRQMHASINTTVVSISIICILQFLTICILSSSLGINQSVKQQLKEVTLMDLSIRLYEDKSVVSYLEEHQVDTSLFTNTVEFPVYQSDLSWQMFLEPVIDIVNQQYPFLRLDTTDLAIRLSDYQRLAGKFNLPEVTLDDHQYAVLCDYDRMQELRDLALNENQPLMINGEMYTSSESKCIYGDIAISASHVNTGIYILPDQTVTTMPFSYRVFSADLAGDKNTNKDYSLMLADHHLFEDNSQISLDTRQEIIDNSTGLTALFIFVGLYLGIVFLVAGAALLALKQLSESSDNAHRYSILRQLGTTEKMIHQSLFIQIGLFFLFPLALACVHSIFGMMFANNILMVFGQQALFIPILITALFIVLIYGGYFIITYIGSKVIVHDAF